MMLLFTPSKTIRWLTRLGYLAALALFFWLRWTHIEMILATPVAQVPIIDTKYYLEWGQRITSGLGLGVHPFFMSPLYPLFIALAGGVGHGFTASTLHLQMLLSAGTLLLIGRYSARLAGHPFGGPLAGILYAIYAPSIYYDGAVLSANLILFLTMVALTLLDPDDPADLRWWRIAGAGLAIGLSSLARPNALILLPAFALVLLWQGWRPMPRTKVRNMKRAWVSVGILALATVLVILPAMLRNVRLGGEFSLTTSSAGMNLYVGNHAESNGLYTEVPWLLSAEPADEAEGYRREAMRRTGHELTDLAASRYWFGEALKWMAGHPLDWLKLEAEKLAYFFHNEEPPNNVSFYGVMDYSRVLHALGWIRFGVLAALGLPGLFLFGGGRKTHLARALLFAYLAANLLFFVAGEYRYPVVGVLIPAAVFTIFRIVAWFRDSDPIPGLRSLMLIVVLVLVTHIPWPVMRTIASSETDYFNWASVSYAREDLSNASLLFSAALAKRPGWKEAHLQLGLVFRDMGLRDLSQLEFDAAGVTARDLELFAAQEEMAQQWLGVADLDTMNADELAALAAQFNILNRHNAALSIAVKALEKDSTNMRARLEQAYAFEANGRLEEAIELYRRLEFLSRADPMPAYRMAWCYYDLGEGILAQKALARAKTKAEQLPPDSYREEWLQKLGKAALELGNM